LAYTERRGDHGVLVCAYQGDRLSPPSAMESEPDRRAGLRC
jgi:hypothetical protein